MDRKMTGHRDDCVTTPILKFVATVEKEYTADNDEISKRMVGKAGEPKPFSSMEGATSTTGY